MAKPKLTDEELLKLAQKQTDKEANPSGLTTIEKFIVVTQVKPGMNKVPTRGLYEAYCTLLGEKALSKIAFFQEFAKYFAKESSNNIKNFYKLNLPTWEIISRCRSHEKNTKK